MSWSEWNDTAVLFITPNKMVRVCYHTTHGTYVEIANYVSLRLKIGFLRSIFGSILKLHDVVSPDRLSQVIISILDCS
jgi:hypothetical protein